MNNLNIIVGLECFVKKDGKYLMLHRDSSKKIMPDVWMAPGGKLEPGEGLYECARREIKEETGLDIKNLRLKAVGNALLMDSNQYLYFYFIFADYSGGELLKNPIDGELRWLTPNQIFKLENLLAEIHKIGKYIFSENTDIISYKVVYDKGNNLIDFKLELP